MFLSHDFDHDKHIRKCLTDSHEYQCIALSLTAVHHHTHNEHLDNFASTLIRKPPMNKNTPVTASALTQHCLVCPSHGRGRERGVLRLPENTPGTREINQGRRMDDTRTAKKGLQDTLVSRLKHTHAKRMHLRRHRRINVCPSKQWGEGSEKRRRSRRGEGMSNVFSHINPHTRPLTE